MGFLPRLKPQGVVAALATLVLLGYGVMVAFMLNMERGERQRGVARNMRHILLALTHYEERTGHALPPSAGLSVLVEEGLLEALPVDPWGHDYKYRVEAGSPVILSYGRDGIPDGEGPDADLSSLSLLAE
ncbi:type II secretion system protein GspG [Corallococcus sp. AB049A]|uniref:Type II secretion system protein GspG n=1 Tax=Corallococcus interemptor TaxID=2316720 RepID=A0A3A8PVW8_9BACT|nr:MULTISPECIES: type II secretion system protein GspG [Corallococcus]RKH38614.1 type II secretion system protein GspG [Corallococcus sp. AB050B]RKH60597.1 type II secretion system protein GspG [Corallococcus interemptor]RKI62515.1 type II secretion system protein GspG [Corallococcus sp. AB049A]